jgi:hypothetical protein
MKRLEYKYLVPEEALVPLREWMRPFVKSDRHMGLAGEYTVRSIYFDTGDLDYYYQKEAGIQHRRKLRIRAYGEEDEEALAFLEIKRKDDMAISKARAVFRFGDGEALFASGDLERYLYNAGEDPQALKEGQSFFFHLYRYALMPTILICYEREAFFGQRDPSLRLTLDKNLRSSPFPRVSELYSEGRQRRSLAGHFILEIKFGGLMPGWLKGLLEHYQLERRALSKYAICMEEQRIPQRSSAFSTWALSHRVAVAESPRVSQRVEHRRAVG